MTRRGTSRGDESTARGPAPAAGAATQDLGLIEAADRGMVFLDDAGELSPPIQGKLLRPGT
jgi:transcriptional regulator of aromatic amino acid metabolism